MKFSVIGRYQAPLSSSALLRRAGIAALLAACLFGHPVPAYSESGYRSAIEFPGFLWLYGRALYPTKDEGCLKGFEEIKRYLGYPDDNALCSSVFTTPSGGRGCAFGLPEGGCDGRGIFFSSQVFCPDTSINSLGGL